MSSNARMLRGRSASAARIVSSADSDRLGEPSCDTSAPPVLPCRDRSLDRELSGEATAGVSRLSKSSSRRRLDDRSNSRALRRCSSSSPCSADSARPSSSTLGDASHRRRIRPRTTMAALPSKLAGQRHTQFRMRTYSVRSSRLCGCGHRRRHWRARAAARAGRRAPTRRRRPRRVRAGPRAPRAGAAARGPFGENERCNSINTSWRLPLRVFVGLLGALAGVLSTLTARRAGSRSSSLAARALSSPSGSHADATARRPSQSQPLARHDVRLARLRASNSRSGRRVTLAAHRRAGRVPWVYGGGSGGGQGVCQAADRGHDRHGILRCQGRHRRRRRCVSALAVELT